MYTEIVVYYKDLIEVVCYISQLWDSSICILSCGPVDVWKMPDAVEDCHITAVECIVLILHYQVL